MTILVAAQERCGYPAIDPGPAVGCLVNALLARGERVRVLAPPHLTAGWPEQASVVPGDINQPDELASAFVGTDRALISGLSPKHAEAVMELIREAGLRRIVLFSSAAAEIEQKHQRDPWFRLVEETVENSGLEWTHLRPAGLMFDVTGWAPAIRAGEVLRAPFSDVGYPLLHEDDFADVAAAALLDEGHSGEAYSLTGPESLSPEQQVRQLGHALGREIAFEALTPEQAREQWLALGRPADEVDLELFVMSEFGDQSIPADTTLARVLARPGRTFAQWAAEHVTQFH